MNFNKWIETLIEEKEIYPAEIVFEIEGESGYTNYIPLDVVIATIKNAPKAEQNGIRDMLVKIDFTNGDIVDYFEHLAQAIAI